MVALSSLFTALYKVRRAEGIDYRGSVLGSCLSPVLVDAVLELDDGEVANLPRQGSIEEDGLLYVGFYSS
jgi:hypothetical protein